MRALGVIFVCILMAACSRESAPTAAPVAAVDAAPAAYRGIWSASGVRLFDRKLASPDGRHTLEWTPRGVEISGAWEGVLAEIAPTAAPELLWSPTGDQVAISWSEGGAVGPWRLNVIDLGGDIPSDIGVSQLFFLPFGCAEAGANVAAGAWLSENELLVVAERPESSCTSGSLVTGLRVGLESGQQGGEIAEDALLGVWGERLGQRVLNAETTLADQRNGF